VLLTLLETGHLCQQVNFPTHKSCHTLDLLISRVSSDIITTVDYTIPFLSDHYAIHAILTIPQLTPDSHGLPSLSVPFDLLILMHSPMTYSIHHFTIPLQQHSTLISSYSRPHFPHF
jgi:hypothetical protein